ncbi:flagellar hook assembly protein FlgD [Halomonas shantousis]
MTSPIGNSTLAAINGTASSGSSRTTGANTADELNDRFMTLLITQLKNQDPLNPMENAELTSQMAQINTVSGIQELNTTLEGITGQIEAGQSLQATALIGQGVLVPGNEIRMGSDADGNVVTTPIGIELGKDVDNIDFTITDASGQVVAHTSSKAVEAGVQSFYWDGMLEGGATPAPDGVYYVSRVEATVGDEPVSSYTLLNYGLVSGVMKGDGEPLLDLGPNMDDVKLADVRQIL